MTARASDLLREARQRAGLTQTELARQAGVTQSVISAYESGRRQPALPTLAALVEAAGLELVVSVEAAQGGRAPLSGPVGRLVAERRGLLVEIAARYGAGNLRVFGSVARGTDRPTSDVDLIMELSPTIGIFDLGRLRHDLESALDGVPVDLVPAQSVKSGSRQEILSEAVAL